MQRAYAIIKTSMSLFSSVGDFFALDIGTTAVRAVQLKHAGNSWQLVRYGLMPVDIKLATSDAPEDQRRLSDVIMNLISQSGITTRNVAVGLPSNKTFLTVVDLPELPLQELTSTIKYQAEQFIPMQLDDAKIDWAVLGKSLRDPSKVEVLLASVSKKFSEARLDMVEALGLNVVALEPDSLAIVRSLTLPGSREAHLIIDFGDFSTDIVAVLGDAPRLIRSIPVGMQTLVRAATQNLNVDANQATQFITKFGLYPDRLEGQILKSLEPTLEQFASEVTKSAKFFQTRYPNIQINSMVLSGYTLTIPAFNEFIGAKTGLPTTVGNAWTNVRFSESLGDQLSQIAPQFAVAVGLAERLV